MPSLWYRTITDGYRLRVGRELMEEAKWLSPTASGKCTVTVGVHGQILFFPEDKSQPLYAEIDRTLAAAPLRLEEVNEPWLECARFAAAQWSVNWGFESAGDRFVFYLTRELFDRDLLPDEKETVAVFAVGGFFEVWKPNLWMDHAKQLGRDIGALQARAKQRLDAREQR